MWSLAPLWDLRYRPDRPRELGGFRVLNGKWTLSAIQFSQYMALSYRELGPYSLSECPDVREEQRLAAQVAPRICVQCAPHFRFFCRCPSEGNDTRVPDAA